MSKDNYQILKLRNRATGTEWYSRQKVSWRPPRHITACCPPDDELKVATSAYEYAAQPDADPAKIHPLWAQAPDWSAPPAPPPRPQDHPFVVELRQIAARLDEIWDESNAWVVPEGPTVDPYEHGNYLRGIAVAARMLERTATDTANWSANWPPDPKNPAPITQHHAPATTTKGELLHDLIGHPDEITDWMFDDPEAVAAMVDLMTSSHWEDHNLAAIYVVKLPGEPIETFNDLGEVEDQNFTRNWGWVPDLVQRAFAAGCAAPAPAAPSTGQVLPIPLGSHVRVKHDQPLAQAVPDVLCLVGVTLMAPQTLVGTVTCSRWGTTPGQIPMDQLELHPNHGA